MAITIFAALLAMSAYAGTTSGTVTFSNIALLRPDGSSEPEIRSNASGNMAMVGLSWENFFTHLWTGPFNSTPGFRGEVDGALQLPGQREVLGGEDADVDLGSTGTVNATTLILLTPPTLTSAQLGVSAIRCPSSTVSGFRVPADCHSQIIDLAGADRPWITSDHSHVYISYHDAGSSTLIHIQRSDDDGLTWRKVGDPVVAQGALTGDATFNNDQGPIVADPSTHNVYDIYAAGQASIQKATNADFNNILVSRSTNLGLTWRANLVFHAPLNTALNNVFPTLAVDSTTGKLYAAWSDAHHVFFSSSSDHGTTWSSAIAVNVAPANTAVFPWLAAYNGKVDLVYYGTSASSKDSSSAVWNVYLAQTVDGHNFVQSRVSNTPNHVGVICTAGVACASGTRNLLDLFQVAIDPQNGKAAVIYTNDRITTDSSGHPLPQVVLAQQQ